MFPFLSMSMICLKIRSQLIFCYGAHTAPDSLLDQHRIGGMTGRMPDRPRLKRGAVCVSKYWDTLIISSLPSHSTSTPCPCPCPVCQSDRVCPSCPSVRPSSVFIHLCSRLRHPVQPSLSLLIVGKKKSGSVDETVFHARRASGHFYLQRP